MEINERTAEIIEAAIEVHKHLGPGLLEHAYQACLEYEFIERNIPFDSQVPLRPLRSLRLIQPGNPASSAFSAVLGLRG